MPLALVFLHPPGFVLVAAAIPVLVVWGPGALTKVFARIPLRLQAAVIPAACALFLVAFVVVAPSFDPEPGGSDRDDAVEIGTRLLLHGDNPYQERTYLGNAVSTGPGALLFAVPFKLLGSASFQNVFWFGAALYVVAGLVGSKPRAFAWMAGLMGCAFIVDHEFLTGGDMVANILAVLVLAILVHRHALRPGLRAYTLSLLLGIALASRVSTLLVLPPLWAWLRNDVGSRKAFGLLTVAGLAFLFLVVPLFFMPDGAVNPLTVQAGKLDLEHPLVPGLGTVAPFLLAGLLVWQAFRRVGDVAGFVGAVALGQALWPVTTILGAASLNQAVDGALQGFWIAGIVCTTLWLELTRDAGSPWLKPWARATAQVR